jgi:superfamily II DNA/RNA helicase
LVATPLLLLKQLKCNVYDISQLKYFIMDEADKYFELVNL